MNLPLVQTATLFVIPFATAIVFEQYIYAILMFALIYTSVINHAFTHLAIELIDRIYVCALVFTLTVIAAIKSTKDTSFTIIVMLSIAAIMAYIAAKKTKDTRFHALLHIMGATGLTLFSVFWHCRAPLETLAT